MAAKSEASKGKYLRQKARTTENKKKALRKHLANHPNDKQNQRDIPLAINAL